MYLKMYFYISARLFLYDTNDLLEVVEFLLSMKCWFLEWFILLNSSGSIFLVLNAFNVKENLCIFLFYYISIFVVQPYQPDDPCLQLICLAMSDIDLPSFVIALYTVNRQAFFWCPLLDHKVRVSIVYEIIFVFFVGFWKANVLCLLQSTSTAAYFLYLTLICHHNLSWAHFLL